MKRSRKIISLVLMIAMLFSISFTALAEDNYAEVVGTITEVQKYGNITLDIEPKALYDAGYELGDMLKVTAGDIELEIPFCSSYSDVDSGSLVVRDDQDDNLLVVAVNMGDFATTYNVAVGDKIAFSLLEKGGYLAEYLIHQLDRTNERSDYESDSIYANFRSITTTGIEPAVLYRSSSPVNNSLNRAIYADKLAKAVGINAVLNLADSKEEIEGYILGEDFNSDYYKSLYDEGKVLSLNMGVDISGEDFGKKLADGLRFLSKNEGPYLVHCTEGKDRAGFVSALLESLMGATFDEVVDDYMTTYENYYKIEKGNEQYNSVAESNIIASLTTVVAGLQKGADISGVDLAKAAEKYLEKIDMTNEEINTLKSKLSVDSIYKTPSVSATITEIEKYGHASTDVLIEDFYNLGFKEGDMVTAIFENGFVLEAPFLDNYYVDNGQPLVRAYPGHTNICICINYGKLNEIAKVDVGDKVTIMLTNPEGYKLQYEVRKLERTNNREDYNSNEEFANFRNIAIGNIPEGVLYRSSSPINNELGRASYSDELIKEAKVNIVVNLADSHENIDEYLKAEDFASPYYAELYKNNKVLPLSMGAAYKSDEFKASLIEGLSFMANNVGPYHFHCTEGKDRAGYFAALIESLMGATKDEIVEDYMQSYINYYGVEKGTDKYNLISEDVIEMLKHIADTDKLDDVNLEKAAEDYLLAGGMTAEKISQLKNALSGKAVLTEEVTVEETPEVVEETTGEEIAVNEEATIENDNNVVEEPKEEPSVKTYVVVKGDCLWNIAQKELGNGSRYIEIYNLNKDIIKNPNMIQIGQELALPTAM